MHLRPIPASTVAVDLNAGTLPTFTVGAATGTLTGSVGTTLTSTTYAWNGIDATKMAAVSIPGAYTLVSDSAVAGLDVAAPSTYNVANGQITIAADSFVTDVLIDGSEVAKVTPQSNG